MRNHLAYIPNVQTYSNFICTKSFIKFIRYNVFKGSTKLVNISMNNNELQVIGVYEFSYVNNLQFIDLSDNSILYISYLAFIKNKNLNTILLNNNKLTVVDISLSKLSNMINLEIINNRVNDIYYHEFFSFLSKPNSKLKLSLVNPICKCMTWIQKLNRELRYIFIYTKCNRYDLYSTNMSDCKRG